MTNNRPVVLILGSGPNVTEAADWPKEWFDQIIVMNNAWRVRPDWDVLVFPEDFPADRMPPKVEPNQRLIEADAFVPAQNLYGGFIMAGATMAYTTAYWALSALRPRVMAFMGCDMVYPKAGDTHFYGTGAADPLRDDITLRDLGAKSARLGAIASDEDCVCVNLSSEPSSLLFPRSTAERLRSDVPVVSVNRAACYDLRRREEALGYHTPDGRYVNDPAAWDMAELSHIDAAWRSVWAQ